MIGGRQPDGCPFRLLPSDLRRPPSDLSPINTRKAMFADTIAAIATPLGSGGLGVIRISGAQALAVADRCFAPAGKASVKPSVAPTHTIHFGHIIRKGE